MTPLNRDCPCVKGGLNDLPFPAYTNIHSPTCPLPYPISLIVDLTLFMPPPGDLKLSPPFLPPSFHTYIPTYIQTQSDLPPSHTPYPFVDLIPTSHGSIHKTIQPTSLILCPIHSHPLLSCLYPPHHFPTPILPFPPPHAAPLYRALSNRRTISLPFMPCKAPFHPCTL